MAARPNVPDATTAASGVVDDRSGRVGCGRGFGGVAAVLTCPLAMGEYGRRCLTDAGVASVLFSADNGVANA